jgi:hypothetical protein
MGLFSQFMDLAAEKSYGFGVKPYYPIIWSIIIIGIFGLFIFQIAFDNNIIEGLKFSFIVFLSGAKFLADPPDVKGITEISGSWRMIMFNLERALGAIFQGLFILAITKTVVNI